VSIISLIKRQISCALPPENRRKVSHHYSRLWKRHRSPSPPGLPGPCRDGSPVVCSAMDRANMSLEMTNFNQYWFSMVMAPYAQYLQLRREM
ncbi:unnamed protein product, partial [Ranitomeya imitator]